MRGLVSFLAAAIPTARTQEIEGTGHAAPFDATKEFVRLIAEASRNRVPGRRFAGLDRWASGNKERLRL